MSESNENRRFGLTASEFDNLKGGVAYLLSIVLTVTITFLILAVGANMLGMN